jgi:hypothetical protein
MSIKVYDLSCSVLDWLTWIKSSFLVYALSVDYELFPVLGFIKAD